MKRFLFFVIVFSLQLTGLQTPIRAGNAAAVQRADTVALLDGREIIFSAYLIDNSNYCKLRDVAYVLNGTERQFDVTYSGNTVSVETGKPYAALGEEMAIPPENATGQPAAFHFTVDGEPTAIGAYLIDGYNYVKLRELAEKLNFGLNWNAATNTVEIRSDRDYRQETPSPYTDYVTAKNRSVVYLKARLAENCPMASYETYNIYIKNTAFTYDNAVAAMALDAYVTAVAGDRYKPDRIRNAYMKGDPTALPGWWTDAWYEDAYQVGTNVGNSSFMALAMLQYDRRWGGGTYLQTAETVMDWVLQNCADGTPGFMYGYDGWPENGSVSFHTFKSTEHNIDAYAAFRRLYAVTGDRRYEEASKSALRFLNSMYDRSGKCFWIGTESDGVTPVTSNIVLDAQVWAVLATEGGAVTFPDVPETVADMRTEEGGYPFHKANSNGGYWSEGTAFTALMFRTLGAEDKSLPAFRALQQIQLPSGGFPAATVPALTTGESWTYGTDTHIAPAAWFVMAVNGFNPYEFK